MKIEIITVGGFAMNCYLIIDEESGEAIYVDPGAEAEHLINKVSQLRVTPKFIINTHCHIDHTAEVATVKNHFNIPFYIHKSELSLLDSLKDQGSFFGVDVTEIPEVTDYVDEGDTLKFGEKQITILHTPGHSPGGISIRIDSCVFVGDCLFMDSIGRTDLPGGNYEQLIGSIKTKLLTLEDSTNVYPGHGPSTTIGRERLHNPFLQ